MLTEAMDEGLVLLGRILGWDPIDLTYASLLETGDGMIRWDDKPVKKAPKPKDLDSHVSAAREKRRKHKDNKKKGRNDLVRPRKS